MEYCGGGDLLQSIQQHKTAPFCIDDVGLATVLQFYLTFFFFLFSFLDLVSFGFFFFVFQILRWFAQMCAATHHIHDKRVLHRDLKSKVPLCRVSFVVVL